MSYEKCKNIILKPKANQIFITIASNNVRPLYYTKYEYSRNEKSNFEEKLLDLMISMLDGNIQISQLNKNTIPFEYAILKVKNYYRENNIDEYVEKFNKRYSLYDEELSKYVDTKDFDKYRVFARENKDLINTTQYKIKKNLYKTEFELFKNCIKENIEGKYYLKNKFGSVIEFVRETNNGYSYRAYERPNENCLIDYKLAYIRKNMMGNNYEIAKYQKVQENKFELEDEEEEYEE